MFIDRNLCPWQESDCHLRKSYDSLNTIIVVVVVGICRLRDSILWSTSVFSSSFLVSYATRMNWAMMMMIIINRSFFFLLHFCSFSRRFWREWEKNGWRFPDNAHRQVWVQREGSKHHLSDQIEIHFLESSTRYSKALTHIFSSCHANRSEQKEVLFSFTQEMRFFSLLFRISSV